MWGKVQENTEEGKARPGGAKPEEGRAGGGGVDKGKEPPTKT